MIHMAHCTKRFGDFIAVNDVSFTVESGEVFAFLGPNGAGKTTTVKMLTTLLLPTSGAITINGHDPVREPDAVRRSFGIVFQDPSVDDELTAWENLEVHGVLYGVPRATRRQRMAELLALVDLADRRDAFVRTFSGGMKRRLEIARGLLHHPAILFLDEPTLGLDPQTRNHMWSYIASLNKTEGMTIFFTTHYMEEADRAATRLAIIDHGKIVAMDSPAGIKAKAGAATLEDAFLKLTGTGIRSEEASGLDRIRQHRRAWTGR
ncbi:ATP-binding cassette domain-containing protein [Candidatus Uhrbacteria bacterium]|nr:ATP-binding cassette domain-containing protein [Candidatus Uhrbacteria bacterium]